MSCRATWTDEITPHAEALRRYALRLTRDPHDADDLWQETMARAWRYRARYEAGGNARAWLCAIMRSIYCSSRKVSKVRAGAVPLFEALNVADPRPLADAREQLDPRVKVALMALPEVFRHVVALRELAGLTYDQIAHALDIRVGTVMSRLYRGRKLLREQLAEVAREYGLAA